MDPRVGGGDGAGMGRGWGGDGGRGGEWEGVDYRPHKIVLLVVCQPASSSYQPTPHPKPLAGSDDTPTTNDSSAWTPREKFG